MKFRTILMAGTLAAGTVQAEDSLAQKLKKRCGDIQAKNYTSDIEQAKDYYFYGDRCASTRKEKQDWHTKGGDAAKRAVSASSASDHIATAHYYAAINLSRWGLATGVLTALNRWNEVEKHLEKVIEHGASTGQYGAYRSLGRAYYKLPAVKVGFGKYKKSEEYLKMAYTKTLHPTFKTSTNVLNTLFYLDTLRYQDNDGVFCPVYEQLNGLLPFNEGKSMQLNPDLVMENLLDMQNFVKPPKSDKGEYIQEIKEYADINC